MSVTYLRDDKELSTRELVATYYKGVSLPQGYDFGKENTIVLPSPKPECGELERAVRDGVTTDDNGNTVQAWKVVDMFNDYQAEKKDVDGEQVYDADGNKVYYTVTKAEQEAEYLAKKQEQETKAKVQEVTGIIDQYIQAKVDEYNMKNGTLFEKVHNCVAYKDIEGYAHQKFCQDVLVWNAQVWETARQVQVDVLTGVRQEPTEEELLAELPILEL
jgi:hypothetical protein